MGLVFRGSWAEIFTSSWQPLSARRVVMTDRALPSAVAAHGPVTPCGYFYLAHTSEYAFASTRRPSPPSGRRRVRTPVDMRQPCRRRRRRRHTAGRHGREPAGAGNDRPRLSRLVMPDWQAACCASMHVPSTPHGNYRTVLNSTIAPPCTHTHTHTPV